MKRQYGKIMQRIAALMLGAFLFASPMAQAATNTALGDIAGVGGDLDDSNTFELIASTSTLVKTAFLTVGNTALSDGDRLPVGTSVDFLIYINKTMFQNLAVNNTTSMLSALGGKNVRARGKFKEQSRWVLPVEEFDPADYYAREREPSDDDE